MELREWAIRILSADTLEEKLFSPDLLTDHEPGEPLIFNEPVRPIGMGFNKRSKEQKLPSFQEHGKEETEPSAFTVLRATNFSPSKSWRTLSLPFLMPLKPSAKGLRTHSKKNKATSECIWNDASVRPTIWRSSPL